MSQVVTGDSDCERENQSEQVVHSEKSSNTIIMSVKVQHPHLNEQTAAQILVCCPVPVSITLQPGVCSACSAALSV